MILAPLAAVASASLAVTASTIAVVERQIIIRLRGRRAAAAAPPSPPPPAFREKKGPRCVHAIDISAAAVTGPAQIDFAMKGGERIRAVLEAECPALDFYRGFYLSPSADGKVCADRDVVRTRAGGECAIDRLRQLVPVDAAAGRPR